MSDREAAIRDSFPRYDKLLAELAAAREENALRVRDLQTASMRVEAAEGREAKLREALDAAMQYVAPKDRDWIERLADGEGET